MKEDGLRVRSWRVFSSLFSCLALLAAVALGSRPEDLAVASPELREAIRSATAGDYTLALGRFSALLSKDAENPQLLYYVGLCHLFRGETRPAVSFFERSISQDPPFPEVYYWAARAYRSSNEPHKAGKCVEDGLKRFPRNKKLLSLKE